MNALTRSILLACLLLSGCGSVLEGAAHGAAYDETESWPEWTGNSEEENQRFTVNYDRNVTPGPWLYLIDEIWRDVQACVGIAAPDPHLTIEYVPLSQLPITDAGFQVYAYITYRSRYIRVVDHDLPSIDGNNLRHEFVHYLLWYAGVPQDDLDNHNSPFYEECRI